MPLEPHSGGTSTGVIAVGAVNMDGSLMPWTSYGSWVAVMAPGVDLPLPAGETGPAPSISGTSWSCAIVSGIVALLLQVDPELTPRAALSKRLLIESAHPSKSGKAGVRIVDAYLAAAARPAPGAAL